MNIQCVCSACQFVAHPNCQQHLTTIWFGADMAFLQSFTLWQNILMWVACVPLVPFFCIMYIISPNSRVRVILSSLKKHVYKYVWCA